MSLNLMRRVNSFVVHGGDALKLSSSEAFVLDRLAWHANDQTGACFPAQVTLAKETRLHLRTVKRVLSRLEAQGLILRAKRKTHDGDGYSYALNINDGRGTSTPSVGDIMSPSHGAVDGDINGGSRCHGDIQRVTSCRPVGVMVSPDKEELKKESACLQTNQEFPFSSTRSRSRNEESANNDEVESIIGAAVSMFKAKSMELPPQPCRDFIKKFGRNEFTKLATQALKRHVVHPVAYLTAAMAGYTPKARSPQNDQPPSLDEVLSFVKPEHQYYGAWWFYKMEGDDWVTTGGVPVTRKNFQKIIASFWDNSGDLERLAAWQQYGSQYPNDSLD